MAGLQCPNCGKDNPDFLDNCQFCQTPLRAESSLQFGENPVKKHTGELEPILPQWLQDVRQQSRDSAEEDAAEEAAKPKIRNEPPDLLAGLAAQANDEGDDVPDWLAGINPLGKADEAKKPSAPSVSDFFAQFEKSAPESELPRSEEEPASQSADMPAWMGGSVDSAQTESKDELSEWFTQASAEESKPVEIESNELGWMNDATALPPFNQPEPAKEPEDLSWLHALEDSTKQPEQPSSLPAFESNSLPGADASAPDDLSWLNQLGGSSAFAFDAPTPAHPEEQKPEPPPDELLWLNNLGSVETPATHGESSMPVSPAEALDWLTPQEGKQISPFEEKPAESNLDWLKGGGQETLINPTPAETPSPFTKIPTGSLDGGDTVPDWLKSATEEPSMPAPGALSDWFKDDDAAAHSPFQPVPIDPTFIPAPMDAESLSNKDIDSLFSVNMPDWLSDSKSTTEEDVSQQTPAISTSPDESLAPVNLPSWVQAMRPAESAVVAEPASTSEEAEREGPLAGLQGVIPVAPIGSSRRPKAVSLKLQASDEQQTAASILETVLAGETTARAIGAQSIVASQRILRWVLSGLFLIVLSSMIFMRTRNLPISPDLPAAVRSAAGIITRLPQNSSMLIVIDYEPALAPEMEAISGPLLDQLVLTTRARLVFISTSPSGAGLVNRLLLNTGISSPAGINYQPGTNFVNLGYLPGGASGVREFIDAPSTAMPGAIESSFSEYAAVIVLTDNGESGRLWVEQLVAKNQADAGYFAFQPLLFAASAQATPLLQPYVDSEQINGMVGGLADAARYEFVNNSRPGIARIYWDTFGIGMMLGVVMMIFGSLWSLTSGILARRKAAEAG